MKPRIVVVGAAVGELFALQELLGELPAEFPYPVVIVQHRSPDADSKLLRLLQHACALPVSEPDDKQPIVPGHVYLAPADYHLLIDGDTLALSMEAPVSFARPSIDVLFESAADAYGSGVLALMLTSSIDDGALGARAIERAGGRVILQDQSVPVRTSAPRAMLVSTLIEAPESE